MSVEAKPQSPPSGRLLGLSGVHARAGRLFIFLFGTNIGLVLGGGFSIQEDVRDVVLTRYGGDLEMNLSMFPGLVQCAKMQTLLTKSQSS